MSSPEYHSFEEFQNRTKKLHEIKDLGIDPYPHKFEPTYRTKQLQEQFKDKEDWHFEDAEKNTTQHVKIAGRLVLFRAMGKNAFAQVQDETGRIQIVFNRDHTHIDGLPENSSISPIKFIEKKVDLGDIIGIEGYLFKTQKKELTVFVKTFTLLCKSLLPLPDKHAGLSDKGVRYRKRWLDLISTPSVIHTFKMRSEIIKLTREYLSHLSFMEVETPILQNIYGGAEASPFITHINALNQPMYLRIALEISLKKLLVGGLERVYEIGKVFRNEGLDKTHNPEFTMIEAYMAYMDYNDIMQVIENLFASIAQKLFGTTLIGTRKDKKGQEHNIDLKTPWIRMTMKDAIKTYGQLNVDSMTDIQLRDFLLEKTDEDPSKIKASSRGKLIAMLFEELAEPHLIQPHHIIDHPIETTPLCKLHRNEKEKKEKLVERFETFILGMEFCNAYSELNDPILQRELLEDQASKRDLGDEEAHPMDEEFIEAICQGMPPTGGFGIGIDRMCMLFTGETSIRDVLFFPIMRPEESHLKVPSST